MLLAADPLGGSMPRVPSLEPTRRSLLTRSAGLAAAAAAGSAAGVTFGSGAPAMAAARTTALVDSDGALPDTTAILSGVAAISPNTLLSGGSDTGLVTGLVGAFLGEGDMKVADFNAAAAVWK